MDKKTAAALLLAASTVLACPPTIAASPTLHEVYQAAEAGRLGEAQGMMDKVLKDHPSSGKAHFVEAELLAKQGDFTKAREELANAERLSPGLPFAKPQAVENLKSMLQGTALQPAATNALPASDIPWGMLLGGLCLIAFIVWGVRLMASRNTRAMNSLLAGGIPADHVPAGQPYGSASPVARDSGGLGTRIMGWLATGAAAGAGIIAGEAIARHFIRDDDATTRNDSGGSSMPSTSNIFNDLGGNDFGVSASNTWGDGSGTDNEWN